MVTFTSFGLRSTVSATAGDRQRRLLGCRRRHRGIGLGIRCCCSRNFLLGHPIQRLTPTHADHRLQADCPRCAHHQSTSRRGSSPSSCSPKRSLVCCFTEMNKSLTFTFSFASVSPMSVSSSLIKMFESLKVSVGLKMKSNVTSTVVIHCRDPVRVKIS